MAKWLSITITSQSTPNCCCYGFSSWWWTIRTDPANSSNTICLRCNGRILIKLELLGVGMCDAFTVVPFIQLHPQQTRWKTFCRQLRLVFVSGHRIRGCLLQCSLIFLLALHGKSTFHHGRQLIGPGPIMQKKNETNSLGMVKRKTCRWRKGRQCARTCSDDDQVETRCNRLVHSR